MIVLTSENDARNSLSFDDMVLLDDS